MQRYLASQRPNRVSTELSRCSNTKLCKSFNGRMSSIVRKPFTNAKTKGSYQLQGNRTADHHLCFCFMDSTIPLLPHLCDCIARFGSNLVGNADHRFSKIQMKNGNKQCLFDTPRKVMVNKEMMSEYQAIRKTVYALS